MRLAQPDILNLLWLVLIYGIFAWWRMSRPSAGLKKSINPKMLPFLVSSLSVSRRRWRVVLQCLALSFVVIALARPQIGQSRQQIQSEGVEIMLLVDVSESMMAEDVRPNRLEQAKLEMSRLLDLMPGNKVGLIAFAGSATILSPLTSDPGALKLYIESLQPNMVSTQGTDFERGLQEVMAAFERGGAATDELTKVTRVVLVASDGESHTKGDIEQARKLVQNGVRIFTLAYGTAKGATIPVRDRMGYMAGYKKDRQGQTILTQVNGDSLRELAREGQGSFYHAAIGGNHLRSIVDDIDRLEKAQFEEQMAVQYDEKFQVFLFIALLFVLLEFFIHDRRNEFRLWKGRFEVPQE